MSPWLIAILILGTNPYLEEGRRLYSGMHYLDAEAQLRLAKDVPTSTPEERRAALELLARCQAAQGHLEDAQGTFSELLAADPSAPAPGHAAPKIQEAFRRAKERLYPPGFVQLRRVPSVAGRIELELVDPWAQVERVALEDVTRPDAPTELPTHPDLRRVSAELDAAPGAERHVYAEARAADGHVLAHLGTAEEPLKVQVAAAEEPAHPALVSPAQIVAEPSALSRVRLYGAGLLHLATLGSGQLDWGGELGASYAVASAVDLGAAVVPGRRTGGQISAALHVRTGLLRPFVQLRVSLTPLETGLSPGIGIWGGTGIELGPGRILVGVAVMSYLLPSGVADSYRPVAVMGMAGYQLDLGAIGGG
jgi:hypothetical protein